MAATITGTFILIDRASDTMKKMERQALQTQAAIEGVGAKLDRNSATAGRSSASSERVTRSLSGLGREADRTGARMTQLARHHDTIRTKQSFLTRAFDTTRNRLAFLGRAFDAIPFGTLAKGLDWVGGKMLDFGNIMTFLKFGGIATGVAALAQAIGTLGGGFVALLPMVGQASGALLALPTIVASVVQGFATFKLAFEGVSKAVEAGLAMQQTAGRDMMLLRDQQRQAANALIDAEHTVQISQRNSRQAQIELTIARREAIREIQDLEMANRSAALAEQRSTLGIAQAKLQLQQALVAPGTTMLQLQDLRLGVREAELGAQQARQTHQRARADANRARAHDPTSAPQQRLVAAQNAVADSAFAAQDALRGLREAQIALNRAMTQGTAAQRAFALAMKQLSPEAQAFVRQVIAMRPAFMSLQAAAGRELFPALMRSMGRAQRALPVLQGVLQRTGGAIGRSVEGIVNKLTTPHGLHDLAAIGNENARVLGRMGAGFGHVITGLQNIMIAARPFTEWLTKTMLGWTKWFEAATGRGRRTGAIAAFLNKTKRALQLFGDIAKHSFGGFMGLMRAVEPLGKRLWTGIDKAARNWDAFANGVGSNKLRNGFNKLYPGLHQLGQLTKELVIAWANITIQPSFAKTVEALRKAVPYIEKLFINVGKLGPSAARLFTDIVKTLSDLPISPMQVLIDLLDALVRAIDFLVRKFPGFKEILSGLLILSVATKMLGLLKSIRLVAAAYELLSGNAAKAWQTMLGNRGGGAGPPAPASPGTTQTQRYVPTGTTTTPTGGGRYTRLKTTAAQIMPTGLVASFRRAGQRAGTALHNGAAKVINNGLVAPARRFGQQTVGRMTNSIQNQWRRQSGRVRNNFNRWFRRSGNEAGQNMSDHTVNTATGKGGLGSPAVGGKFKRVGGMLGKAFGLGFALYAATNVTGVMGSIMDLIWGKGKGPKALREQLNEFDKQGLAGMIGGYKLGDSPRPRQPRSNVRYTRADLASMTPSQRQYAYEHHQVKQHGGLVYAQNGRYVRPRARGTDTVPAMLTPGEFVMRKQAVQKHGVGKLQAMNRGVSPEISGIELAAGILTAAARAAGAGTALSAVTKASTKYAVSVGGLHMQAGGPVPGGPNPAQAARRATNDPNATRDLRATHLSGQRELRATMNDWNRESDQGHGKLKRTQKDTHDTTIKSWGQIHKQVGHQTDLIRAATVNDWVQMDKKLTKENNQMFTQSDTSFKAIYKTVTTQAHNARDEVKKTWDSMRAEAVKQMISVGISKSDAAKAIGGGKPKAHATGGRIMGHGLADSKLVAPNALAAPGELIVNRHTERGVDRDLRAVGRPPLGARVSRESRPHSAPVVEQPYRGDIHRRFATGGYVYPFGPGITEGRIDEGQDMGGSGPIAAIGNAVISGQGQSGWPGTGQGFFYQLLDGIRKGQYVYVYENIRRRVSIGQHVKAGEVIADLLPGYPHLEMGWSTGSGAPTAQGSYHEGQVTGPGMDMHNFLQGLAHGKLFGGGGPGGAAVPAITLKKRLTNLAGVPGYLSEQYIAKMKKALVDHVNSKIGAGAAGVVPGSVANGPAEKMIFDYFSKAGMSKIGIAGLIGNAVQESSLSWTAPGGGMWQQISNFGGGAPSPLVQMSTMLRQIQQSGVFAQMSGAASPQQAADIFERGFEKAGIPNNARRESAAAQAYAAGYGLGGRIPAWGGWNARGGTFVTSGPTVFGAGEAGRERVHISPDRGNVAGGRAPIHVEIHHIDYKQKGDIKKAIKKELEDLADELALVR